ncbi:hypothetical protein NSQ80_16940 [Paenibacillus sp. FSL K6-2441]|uniref:hypothetical protein n=1 Tax=Paenibacillus sp. FSL K6-2441 TaxID=2954679 RepID=UPI0030D9E129
MGTEKKRTYLSQADIPRYTIEKALVIAQTLWDEFAGKALNRIKLLLRMNTHPPVGVGEIYVVLLLLTD